MNKKMIKIFKENIWLVPILLVTLVNICEFYS